MYWSIIYGIAIAMVAMLIDLSFGEPPNRFHPVAWLGSFIRRMDGRIRRGEGHERAWGTLLAIATIIIFSVPITLMAGSVRILFDSIVWAVLLTLILKMTFALHSLWVHVHPIQMALENGDMEGAREKTRMVVSRDVTEMDAPHIISCASETVAENLVDSVISPLFFMSLGGVFLALVLRAVNTLDAMVGYENERNREVGWFSAKLDDVLHFIPARLSVPFILLALRLMGRDWRSGWRAARTDHVRTKSPNKGWPMAAVSGGMGIRMEKPGNYVLGDGVLSSDPHCIQDTYRVARLASIMFFLLFALPLFALIGIQMQIVIENFMLMPFTG
jgi:adenosylcobinamide-phosphate synthase